MFKLTDWSLKHLFLNSNSSQSKATRFSALKLLRNQRKHILKETMSPL